MINIYTESMPDNHYQTLGIARDASADQIKKAYRKLARKYHPDVSKEADAEARMQAINVAYDTLSDAEKKNNTILNSIILKDLLGLMLATKVVLTNLSFIANRRVMVSMRTLVDLKTCLVVLGKALVAVTISINVQTAKPRASVVKTNTPV
jgi:DnaJ-class molecular chaperone with C-terminal Zn finger domain